MNKNQTAATVKRTGRIAGILGVLFAVLIAVAFSACSADGENP